MNYSLYKILSILIISLFLLLLVGCEDDPLLAIKPALNLRAVAINPSHKTLNKKVVEKILSAGLKIYTWTVNNKKQIDKMKKLGVNGIITDYPEKVFF